MKKKLVCLNGVYSYQISKALESSFHRQVFDILTEVGFDSYAEISSLMSLYGKSVGQMEDCVGISRRLDTTNDVLRLSKSVNNTFRALVNDLRNLRYSSNEEVADRFEAFDKVELSNISFVVLKKPHSERVSTLMSFVSHLRSDWMELIEAAGLTERLEMLESALEKHNEVYVLHIEEMAAVDKGRVKRVRKELENLYQVLMFYVQAWANTPDEGESPENVAKYEAARDVVSRVNKLISDLNKSLSVAKSNRRRAKKNVESENAEEINQETENTDL